MSAIERAVELAEPIARHFEGFSATPYKCPAGVWTIGFGTTWLLDGTPVTATTKPVDKDQAAAMLRVGLTSAAVSALKLAPILAGYPEALAAVADFIYNLGAGRFRSSTFRTRLIEQDWAQAAIEIVRWCRASGQELRGLLLRRMMERDLLPV